jgi:hypothetical protein
MTGLDFIGALQANQIDLPIRVFVSGDPMRNLYRPDALSFANLTIDVDEKGASLKAKECSLKATMHPYEYKSGFFWV